MKKKSKIIILILLVIVTVISILIVIINHFDNDNGQEIFDNNTGIYYLCVDNNSYPRISLESAEIGLFSKSIVERMKDVYLCDNNCIISKEENIHLIKKSFFQPKQYGYKQISKDKYVYFEIEGNKILNYFAEAGFEFPELSDENIEYIRLEHIVYSEENNNLIKKGNTIRKILEDPINYFNDNQITDIYVKYKDFDLEEWFDINKLTQEMD